MYNFLVSATKERLLQEIKYFISRHPIYNKLGVYNRFPYKERIQEAIILKNTSANRMALSADNFQANVISYVSVAKYKNTPGLSIEWVREDKANITTKIEKEDVSNQFTIANNTITLIQTMMQAYDDLSPADNFQSVEVFVNNSQVIPVKVDGITKQIVLANFPPINSKVEVSYYVRNLAPPGIYQIEIIEGNNDLYQYKFMVDCVLDKEETLIEKALGTEATSQLASYPVYPNSLDIFENDELMILNTDYLIDEPTGLITFISTPLTNSKVVANYRIKGQTTGPFNIPTFNHANSHAISGVIMAFGRGISVGDKHFVIISQERDVVALEYSGKWEMSLSLDVYLKDSIQVEEVIDLVTSQLLIYRKDTLDGEGIALVDCSFSGESEETYDDVTGQPYYIGSVDYSFLTEWLMHKAIPAASVKGLNSGTMVFETIQPYLPDRNRSFERIK